MEQTGSGETRTGDKKQQARAQKLGYKLSQKSQFPVGDERRGGKRMEIRMCGARREL